MKTEMSEDGVITIRPESSVEAYALRQWVSKAATEGRQWSAIDTKWFGTTDWMQEKTP